MFRCPNCAEPLVATTVDFRCASGHAFDRAREGYVNLLPGGRLKSRPAGDDAAMVRARRHVFDAGLYRPVIERVAATTAESEPSFVLDVGCGEGSYLAAVTAAVDSQGWGIDISKPAVRLAARRHTDHNYAVASASALPFADDSFDAVVNVFSLRDFTEMMRVIRPPGVAIVVTPGPDHLRQLKSSLYDHARRHSPPSPVQGARLEQSESVRFELTLSRKNDRLALLQMTPFWWSATASRRERVTETLHSVTVDIEIGVYRPDKSSQDVAEPRPF